MPFKIWKATAKKRGKENMKHNIILGNRFAGYVENGVFVTRRKKSEHFFRLWQGLGFNQNLINRFIELGTVNLIKVLYEDGEKEKVLTSTPLHLALNATEWPNSKAIKDSQYILPLTDFNTGTGPTPPLLQEVL